MCHQRRVRQASERDMQELQQEKSKHDSKRNAWRGKGRITTIKMSYEKNYGKRNARMTTREKHESEKRRGMHGMVARNSSLTRMPGSRTLMFESQK